MTPEEAVKVLANSVFFSSHGANETDCAALAVLHDHLNIPVSEDWGNGTTIRGGFIYKDGKPYAAICAA